MHIHSGALARSPAERIDPIMTERDTEDSIGCLLQELNTETDAELICAVWHDGDGDGASPLFFSSPVLDQQVGLAMRCAVTEPHMGYDTPDQSRPDDGDRLIRVDVAAGGGTVTIAALFRSTGENGRKMARQTLQRWLPVVGAFFGLWVSRFRTHARMRALTAAVNNSDVSVLLVDGGGRLVFANDSAARVLASKDGLRRQGSLLSGNRLADTLRLQAAIEHVIDGGCSEQKTAPVVALPRSSGRPLLAAVVPADQMPADQSDGGAIVYLFDPDQDIHPSAQPACKMYGLSPVEAKLACLLADGHSLADAAGRMRIREQTARSYLKQIFSKTDTNRQGELVQLMLKSLVRTSSTRAAQFV